MSKNDEICILQKQIKGWEHILTVTIKQVTLAENTLRGLKARLSNMEGRRDDQPA